MCEQAFLNLPLETFLLLVITLESTLSSICWVLAMLSVCQLMI